MPASQATKESAWLVRFDYQTGPTLYTDWTADLSVDGSIYQSVPSLDIDFSPQTGVLDEGSTRIEMPLDSFTSFLSNGEEKPRIEVTITELVMGSGSTDPWIHYLGDVHSSIRNPRGRPNLVRLQCKTIKSRMEAPLGIEADSFCKNIFGTKGCFFDLEAEMVLVTVSSISGQVINAFGHPNQQFSSWYKNGSLTRNGVRILIRDWDQGSDPTEFFLARNPPLEWQGKQVELRPGCLHQIISCRERDNEENWVGLGFGMPSYNPNIENPG